MFNAIMIEQLGKVEIVLRDEILQILSNSHEPLSNIDLEALSKSGANRRDITYALQQLKAQGLVEIDHFDHATYPPRGLWIALSCR
ncbi:hypothetical protein [Methylobacillus flagellatus]|uniref:hypothetical protein n=1 Tax=Methylobacillus flagellatus TaxID=405 RepID=UPI0010F7CE8B|nr:hypothetical protein [Methylobacillus flagellatus]